MPDEKKQTVVFISGFLTPTDWKSYPADLIPQNVNMIPVYPSPTGLLHDRACEVFYELFGGTVDYGQEHSEFHKHERYGRKFETGKLSVWDENNPITVIGHSLGGCTAWVLQNYLAQGMFAGIATSAAWISAVICVSAPLNGALQVHSRGMDICNPPLVRWGSSGCIVGWLAQWSEYFNLDCVKCHMDFQQAHWKISWRDVGVLQKLALSTLGYCLHSNTDNVAYDVTILSQLAWAKTLRTFPDSRYISVVGKLIPEVVTPKDRYKLSYWVGVAGKLLRGEAPPRICDVDTSTWPATGGDGLLSVHTQEYPRLYEGAEYAGVYPQHVARPLLKETVFNNESLALETGVWHYAHHHMSHLNTAMACRDTWGLLMQLVKRLDQQADHHGDQHFSPPQSSTLDSRKPTRPDMQPINFHFPSTSTSTGMAYRQRNVYFAAALVLVLRCGNTVCWRENRAVAIMYVLLLGVAVVHILKPGARKYFSNRMHLIADTAEVVYALYRLVDIFSAVPGVNESTFLCELLLQTLLPRPLLDLSNQHLGVLLAVVMQFVPHVWRAIAHTPVLALLVLFTALPKLCWTVVYFNQREHCALWRVQCRDIIVQWTMSLYLAAWVYFSYCIYVACMTNINAALFSMHSVSIHVLVYVLLALYPLNKFQDLSMCLQVVLMEQNCGKV